MKPEKQFENELSAVFVRWWEESDIDEFEMGQIALTVVDRFCEVEIENDVEFEMDFDLDEVDEE
jgi:hypothetical protein